MILHDMTVLHNAGYIQKDVYAQEVKVYCRFPRKRNSKMGQYEI